MLYHVFSKKMCFESPGNNCCSLPQEKRRRRKEGKKTPKPTSSDTENQIRKEAENEPQASEEATEEATAEATAEAKSNEIDSNVCVTAAATQPSINSTTVLGWDFVKKKFSQFSHIFSHETERNSVVD